MVPLIVVPSTTAASRCRRPPPLRSVDLDDARTMAGGPHEDESATVTLSHPMPLLVPIVHDGVLGCLGDEGQQITQV